MCRQEAAGALWNLSFDDRNREAIATAGGVEALVWHYICYIPLVVNITCIKPLLISLEGVHNIYFVKANTFISFNSDIFPTYLLSWQLTA